MSTHHLPGEPPTTLNIQSGSKILLSGLPADVTENQLRELFSQTTSDVKNVEISYNQSGVSKGVALIEFPSFESAMKSHGQFHGKLIDGVSVITVEIVAAPAPPSLDPPPPTTTIQPAPTHVEPPAVKSAARPVAPRPKNAVKPRPPAPTLSLKQRMELPKPQQPRRFLFNTPPTASTAPPAKRRRAFAPASKSQPPIALAAHQRRQHDPHFTFKRRKPPPMTA